MIMLKKSYTSNNLDKIDKNLLFLQYKNKDGLNKILYKNLQEDISKACKQVC